MGGVHVYGSFSKCPNDKGSMPANRGTHQSQISFVKVGMDSRPPHPNQKKTVALLENRPNFSVVKKRAAV